MCSNSNMTTNECVCVCSAPVQDGEKDLSALCQLWLESKDHVTSKVQAVSVTCSFK